MPKVDHFHSPIAMEPLNGMAINAAYREQLVAAGLDCFGSFWDFQGGEIVKRIRERAVLRISIPAGRGETGTVFYLKKHDGEQPISDWRESEGGREFLHLCRFREAGLATAMPVAAGCAPPQNNGAGSFLLTADFHPLVALETIIRQRPQDLAGPPHSGRRRTLLRAIAAYGRRMHAAGFNHQDFNATHILIGDMTTDRPTIALFDLQRVDCGRLHRFRWPVKALAELNFTLPVEIFPAEDLRYLHQCYAGREHPRWWDRLQWLWIVRKTARIASHTAKRHARRRKT